MSKHLLAIIELGGYPNLMPVYEQMGFEVELATSIRQAKKSLSKRPPDLVVAEYNYQTDFRDRSSNLETLAAVLHHHPQTRLLVYYLPEFAPYFERFQQLFPVWRAIEYPITADKVQRVLEDW